LITALISLLLSLFGSTPATPAPQPVTTGHSVVQTDRTWTCTSKVDLDLVKVTITRAALGDRRNRDAVHLRQGCSGRIGRLEIVQWYGDGVKVAQGAHDLTVGGGSIRCLGKGPVLHQDGIQVMGGERIAFDHLSIDCGRRNSRLINSNFFVNQGRRSTEPPREVVCDECSLGSWAAHTVSVQRSIRSGVENSTICVARFPQETVAVGTPAIAPVREGNHVHQCGHGRLTLQPDSRIVDYGGRLLLRGLFLGQAGGSRVSTLVRPSGRRASARPGASTRTRPNGRFKLILRPAVGETVRLRSGSLRGPAVHVRVRPRLVVKGTRTRLVVRVVAGRSYRGRTVILQVFRRGRWSSQRVVIGRRSKAIVRLGSAASRARLRVPKAPGYVAAATTAVTLR
jgi:hypothetical protein